MTSKISNLKLTIFKVSYVHSWTIASIRKFSSLSTATSSLISTIIIPSSAGGKILKGYNNWSGRGFDQSIQKIEHCLFGRWNQTKMGSLLQTLSWNTSQNSKRLWWLQNQRFVPITILRRFIRTSRFLVHFRSKINFRHLACSSRLASTSWYCPSYGILCQTNYPTDEYNKEKRAASNWTWLHENS